MSSAVAASSAPLREFVRFVRRKSRERTAERDWRRSGCPPPPPPHIKRAILRDLGRRSGIRIFVETGTLHGDTLAALRNDFDQLHSIELDPALYREAVARFLGDAKIALWEGDSGEILARVLDRIGSAALFWLDGHFSGDGTARGPVDTPVNEELRHIARHPERASHLIVIDDARQFDGTNGYPTLEALGRLAADLGFGRMEVVTDMIVLRGVSV